MVFHLLNEKFENIAIIDSYMSAIWTDRYNDYGDFEIVMLPSSSTAQYILNSKHKQMFLTQRNSKHLMFIETKELRTDFESGDTFIISGRSLESLLCRRIVWGLSNVSGTAQNVIENLLNESIINPIPKGSIGNARKISNFVFQKSNDSSIINSGLIHGQYTGAYIYDVVSEICKVYNWGFEIFINEAKQIIFTLYNGRDLSNYVIFSEDFGNLISSNYYESYENYANVTLIGGEDKGTSRVYETYTKETNSGLSRYEYFTDARDVRSTDDDGNTLNTDVYKKALIERGKSKLEEQSSVKSFEGSFETEIQYEYGSDYLVGDIVVVKNSYGISSKCRISEIVFSKDENGTTIVPTFVSI